MAQNTLAPDIDWATTEAAAAELRALLLAGLAGALDAQGGDPVSAPTLAAWLRTAPATSDQVRAEARLQRRFAMTEVSPLAPASRALVAAALPQGLITRLLNRLRRRAPPPEVPATPERMRVLLLQAMTGAAFRRESARLVRDFLSRHVIFWPDERPNPAFSPATLATIAALSPQVANPREAAVIRTAFAPYALTLREAEGWTGFWDLWILERLWATGVPQPLDMTRRDRLAARAAREPPDGKDQQAEPAWHRGRPTYWRSVIDLTP